MQVTLYGAANEVTGSCYLVETEATRMLVDCGMFQGSPKLEKQNHIPKNILSKKLDGVVLTHGHLDHCGRLPQLIGAGYKGPIYCTQATIEIASLVLNDAARIQEDDTERENRERDKKGLSPLEPLFTADDVAQVCRQLRAMEFNEWHSIGNDVQFQLVEAGHILGSGSVLLKLGTGAAQKQIVFSGDLGPNNVPIMRDPAQIRENADLVFLESTYGDRDHRPLAATISEFQELVIDAAKRKGKILIPTFAVGRAQQILYQMAAIFRNGLATPFPIYLDSPMAIAATQLYDKHWDLMDEEAQQLHRSGQLAKDLQTLKPCQTAEQSKALNSAQGPCLILAGAGMCNAGRILHHLRHNISEPSTTVIIVGYQGRGSLGRYLLEGATTVKMFGETVPVRATIKGLGGFSAHAGQTDLLRWVEPMSGKNATIALTHGESHQMNELAHKIRSQFQCAVRIPKLHEVLAV